MTLFQKISTQNLRVMLVIANDDSANVASEVIKKKVGGEVHFYSDIESASVDLKKSDFDWVFTETFLDSDWNAIRLLKELTENPERKDTRVSLFVKSDENYIIPTAFELGCLSYFDAKIDPDHFADGLDELLATAEKCDFEPTLVAATYIRQILREGSSTAEWLQMEKELVGLYPSNSELLLHLAEAHFVCGNKRVSMTILQQLVAIDPKLHDRAVAMFKNYFPDQNPDDRIGEPLNILKLKKVLIVDPDSAICDAMQTSLLKLGAQILFTASDGKKAFEIIEKNRDIDFIILEWKLRELTAPALLQRLRFDLTLSPPVIVHSSLMKKEDKILVEELGVAHVLEKPFRNEQFLKTVLSTIQADRNPDKAASLELKFRNLIYANDLEGAKDIAAQYLSMKNIAENHKLLMRAQLSYAQENYHAAKALALEAIKLTGDTLALLNLLGKTLMKLRDFTTAIRCFEKADAIAPGNLDRICAIAESYSANGEIDIAEVKLERAAEIDANSKRVVEAQAKVSFDKGDTESTKRLMAKIHPMDGMLAFMNNKAVAMAKNGRYEQSIEEYKKAIFSIPDSRNDLKAIITYNLALSYARRGELEEAYEYLERVVEYGESKVIKKGQSLKLRISDAMAQGSELELKMKESKIQQAKEDLVDDVFITERSASEIKRGDMCCYLIYTHKGARDERAEKLLSSTLIAS